LPLVPAHACSCAGGYDPRDALAAADGAIVGTYVSRHPVDPTDEYGDTVYTFSVDEAVKGEFGNTVDIHSGSSGASCGFEMPPGAQTGLFLDLDEGVYRAGLCSQIDPQRLRDAAAPLPAPDGVKPVRYVVGGSFGDQRVVTLDAQGRIIAYGEGDGDVGLLGLCPGSTHITEIVYRYDQPAILVVRELDTLDIVSETPLPIGYESSHPRQSPAGLYCRDGTGGDIAVFSTYDGGGYSPSKGMLWRVRGSDVSRIHSGDGVRAAFAGDHAYIGDGAPGRDIISVDLDSGRTEMVGTAAKAQLVELSVSNDGKRLAGVSFPPSDDQDQLPARVWTMRISNGDVTSIARRIYCCPTDLLWTEDDRRIIFIAAYGKSETYSRGLEPIKRFRYNATDSELVGDEVVGVYYGVVRHATVPGTAQQKLSELPTPTTYSFLAIPD
jgi:hypothetical protein